MGHFPVLQFLYSGVTTAVITYYETYWGWEETVCSSCSGWSPWQLARPGRGVGAPGLGRESWDLWGQCQSSARDWGQNLESGEKHGWEYIASNTAAAGRAVTHSVHTLRNLFLFPNCYSVTANLYHGINWEHAGCFMFHFTLCTLFLNTEPHVCQQ